MPYHLMQPSFPLGRTVATPGAIALGIFLATYMRRHHCGDWGDLCADGKQANEDDRLVMAMYLLWKPQACFTSEAV